MKGNIFYYVLCAVAVLYLGYHLILCGLNTGYRNRYQNDAYMSGETSVTYYAPLFH